MAGDPTFPGVGEIDRVQRDARRHGPRLAEAGPVIIREQHDSMVADRHDPLPGPGDRQQGGLDRGGCGHGGMLLERRRRMIRRVRRPAAGNRREASKSAGGEQQSDGA
jgi:hypothetical protein